MMTGEPGARGAWLVGTQRVGMEGGRVVSWHVQALNEQSVDLAQILIGSKLSFGSLNGWQEARPGTPPRRKRHDITFTGYVSTQAAFFLWGPFIFVSLSLSWLLLPTASLMISILPFFSLTLSHSGVPTFSTRHTHTHPRHSQERGDLQFIMGM